MGRYYSGINFEGKFGFGCQPSTDPEFFDMEEDQSEIQYYLDGTAENKTQIAEKLNKLYDYIDVPKDKREYSLSNDKLILQYIKSLETYIYGAMPQTEAQKRKHIPYSLDKQDYHKFSLDPKTDIVYSLIPKRKDSVLTECRIILGLRIMLDLEKEGHCSLIAEL